MVAIFDLSLTPMSETSSAGLAALGNMSEAFRISLLSCMRAVIFGFLICFSGNGDHL
jgi:hypothetical protein